MEIKIGQNIEFTIYECSKGLLNNSKTLERKVLWIVVKINRWNIKFIDHNGYRQTYKKKDIDFENLKTI